MGEAKRRKALGLPPKKSKTKTKIDESPRLFEWLPFTINQRDNLIKLSIKASWFGIGGVSYLMDCSEIYRPCCWVVDFG